jgi:hypothetical protein
MQPLRHDRDLETCDALLKEIDELIGRFVASIKRLGSQ